MRRVVVIVLALVLAPSMATASWYRCAYDGTVRSACCCPAKHDRQQDKAPAQDASVRATCCCTVTHVTPRAPTAEANPPSSSTIHLAALAVAAAVGPPRRSLASAPIDRPRAQGDPPATLYARRCLLLL
jgi:hypothetical protein